MFWAAFIIIAVFLLNGCFGREKIQAIAVLNDLASERALQEKIISADKDNFAQLVEAIEKNVIKQGLSIREIIARYGEPALTKPRDALSGQGSMVFYEPLKHLGGRKVYLYLDKHNKLSSWEVK